MASGIAILLTSALAQGTQSPQDATVPAVQNVERVALPPGMFDLFGTLTTPRHEMANAGFQFAANYTVDGGYNLTGGEEAGGFVAWLLTATVTVDMARVAKIDGGQFITTWQSYFESNPGPFALVPDWWGYEGLATGFGDINQVSQCYYQQDLLGGAMSIIFGKQDASNNFTCPVGASNSFIHTMTYYPATLVPYLPTYPDQAMGLVIAGKPADWLSLKTGWFDGTTVYSPNGQATQSTGSIGPGKFFDNPGSWFFISEGEANWSLSGGLAGSAGIGGWWQTGPSVANGWATPSPPQVSSMVSGWYAQASQFVYSPEGDSSSGVQLFGSFGWSSPAQNPAQWSIMGGCAVSGLVPGRTDDSFGVAFGYVGFSDSPQVFQSTPGLYECAFEAYYKFALTPWMTLQPDLQVVTAAGVGAELPSAVVGILRLSINF